MTARRTVFVDASYFIALLSQPDRESRRAAAWNGYLIRHKIKVITTEAVLWELLNFFAGSGREVAYETYRRLHGDPQIEVIDFAKSACIAAVNLYRSRADQEWGVIDCLSFEVMRSRAIVAALTYDRHFAQAGFVALLEDDPPP